MSGRRETWSEMDTATPAWRVNPYGRFGLDLGRRIDFAAKAVA